MKIECTQKDWDELVDMGTKKYVSTKNRMDVENAIMQVQNTIYDLDAFTEMYIDLPNEMTTDEVWSYIEGIKNVLKLRTALLWDAHRQREHIDGYGTLQEVMAATYPDAEDCCVPKKKGKKK